MTVLYVLIILILAVVLLLMTKVKVNVISDGELSLKVGAGPIMFTVVPKKQKR